MKNILITGFEPFGGEKINPSYEALKLLPEMIDNAKIHILRLPVIFGKNGALLQQSIDELDPDIIICVGQAGGRSGLTFEKIAINCQNASVPDNDGNQPHDEPVIEQGPAAYFATLPLSQMIAACKKAGFKAEFSYHAGTYVCNDTMYRLLHLLASGASKARGGFIHVPFVPEQVHDKKTSSQSLEETAKCLECAIKAAIEATECP